MKTLCNSLQALPGNMERRKPLVLLSYQMVQQLYRGICMGCASKSTTCWCMRELCYQVRTSPDKVFCHRQNPYADPGVYGSTQKYHWTYMLASMSSICFLNCVYFHLWMFTLVHFRTSHRQALNTTPIYTTKLSLFWGFLEAVGIC